MNGGPPVKAEHFGGPSIPPPPTSSLCGLCHFLTTCLDSSFAPNKTESSPLQLLRGFITFLFHCEATHYVILFGVSRLGAASCLHVAGCFVFSRLCVKTVSRRRRRRYKWEILSMEVSESLAKCKILKASVQHNPLLVTV